MINSNWRKFPHSRHSTDAKLGLDALDTTVQINLTLSPFQLSFQLSFQLPPI